MLEPRPLTEESHFQLGEDYQKNLLRILCEDQNFAYRVGNYLEPKHFENAVLGWAWKLCLQFKEKYGTYPTLATVQQHTHYVPQESKVIYDAILDQVKNIKLRDEAWLRDQVLDFVKRNIFVKAFKEAQGLYNSGNIETAYDRMMHNLQLIAKTRWEETDAQWFFEALPDRQMQRLSDSVSGSSIATGFDRLDTILNGGLDKGELGLWVAYAKTGKSTMLTNLGVNATKLQMKKAAHFVFEGSVRQVADRYESAFSSQLYAVLKRDGLDSKKYSEMYSDYQLYRRNLYIRGFTKDWNYTCEDIHVALKDLKRQEAWEPDLVIVDYGDLLRGRGHFANDRENQKAAFRDLKSLANRGYAVWSASQAQRPEKGSEDKADFLYARQIADCYEKVRVADFIGSLNITNEERKAKVMRLYAELYRDNEAGSKWTVACDFATMTIKSDPNAVSPSWSEGEAEAGFLKTKNERPQKYVNQPQAPKPMRPQL
jgi:hypothetical protein